MNKKSIIIYLTFIINIVFFIFKIYSNIVILNMKYSYIFLLYQIVVSITSFFMFSGKKKYLVISKEKLKKDLTNVFTMFLIIFSIIMEKIYLFKWITGNIIIPKPILNFEFTPYFIFASINLFFILIFYSIIIPNFLLEHIKKKYLVIIISSFFYTILFTNLNTSINIFIAHFIYVFIKNIIYIYLIQRTNNIYYTFIIMTYL
ncbi:hypothetical protein JOC61_000777 [Marinitoga litoralis]|nr:hypothetical protein [Marinitoga litoralis]